MGKHESQLNTPITSYNRNISYPPKSIIQSNTYLSNRYNNPINPPYNNRDIIHPPQNNSFGSHNYNSSQSNNFGFNHQNNMPPFQQSNNFGFNQLRDQRNNFGFNYQDNNFKNFQYPINSYPKTHDSFKSINDRKRRKSIRDNILNSSRRYNRSYNSS